MVSGNLKMCNVCLRCGTRSDEVLEYCPKCGAKYRSSKVTNKKDKKIIRQTPSIITDKEDSGIALSSFDVNRIYCGDSLSIMKQIPDEFVDLIVTSPPYNFGLDGYDKHNDTKSWDDYFTNLKVIWEQSKRILKKGGRICVVVQPLYSDYMPSHHIISQQLRELGLIFKSEIIWEKHNWNCKYTAWGSWKSPSMPYLKYTWEFIEVFCKESQKKNGEGQKTDITDAEFKKWVYAKWEIAPETKMKEFGHPSMFPEEIPYRLIRLFSYVGDVVLDPFNGVGTTTLVAKKLGRNYIGIDISNDYCQKAEERIKKFEQEPEMFPI